jgi:hypothetical protein
MCVKIIVEIFRMRGFIMSKKKYITLTDENGVDALYELIDDVNEELALWLNDNADDSL